MTEDAKKYAEEIINMIKDKVRNGEYEDKNGKKVVEFQYRLPQKSLYDEDWTLVRNKKDLLDDINLFGCGLKHGSLRFVSGAYYYDCDHEKRFYSEDKNKDTRYTLEFIDFKTITEQKNVFVYLHRNRKRIAVKTKACLDLGKNLLL